MDFPDISSIALFFIYVYVPLDQTKNDTDLKFDEHTPLDYNLLSKKVFFCFFSKK